MILIAKLIQMKKSFLCLCNVLLIEDVYNCRCCHFLMLQWSLCAWKGNYLLFAVTLFSEVGKGGGGGALNNQAPCYSIYSIIILYLLKSLFGRRQVFFFVKYN